MTRPMPLRSKAIETVALIGHCQGENAVLFQERIAIIEEPDRWWCVRARATDDPVVGVAATDEFYVGPAVPNEIDLLDVFDVDSMGPIFFDSVRFCRNGRARERENRAFFGATGAQPAPISKPQPSRLMCDR